MSVCKVLMIMLSILVFGLLCFVAGVEFKAGNTGISLFQIMIGLMSLNWTFNTLIATGPEEKSGKQGIIESCLWQGWREQACTSQHYAPTRLRWWLWVSTAGENPPLFFDLRGCFRIRQYDVGRICGWEQGLNLPKRQVKKLNGDYDYAMAA